MISPIEALFIAVIVSASLVTVEKLIAFPFILIFEAAEEASEIFNVKVTKLSPEALTFVDEETALIAIAFEAAEELSEYGRHCPTHPATDRGGYRKDPSGRSWNSC